MFPADFAMDVIDLARAAEERGFESLFLPEHTHIPVKRETPWIGGGSIRRGVRARDGSVRRTGRGGRRDHALKLGTGICLVIQHDPITLAKVVASVDMLSDGRLLFGVGAGWLREEIANHGTDPRTRWRLFGERMRAMETIWTSDEAEFHGQFVNFDPIWSWPKPVQKPRPPVLLGGDVPASIERVIEYADEWMPHPDRGEQPLHTAHRRVLAHVRSPHARAPAGHAVRHAGGSAGCSPNTKPRASAAACSASPRPGPTRC